MIEDALLQGISPSRSTFVVDLMLENHTYKLTVTQIAGYFPAEFLISQNLSKPTFVLPQPHQESLTNSIILELTNTCCQS